MYDDGSVMAMMWSVAFTFFFEIPIPFILPLHLAVTIPIFFFILTMTMLVTSAVATFISVKPPRLSEVNGHGASYDQRAAGRI